MRRFPPDPRHSKRVGIIAPLIAMMLVASSVLLVTPSAFAAPKPAAPTATMTSRSNQALAVSWRAVSGASSYRIRWSTSSKMTKAVRKTLPDTSIELTGLKSNKAYYVQVRALKADGTKLTSYGKAKKMRTLPKSGFSALPPTGLRVTPAGGTALQVSFSPRADATGYRLAVSPDPRFATGVTRTTTSTSYSITGLDPATTYYVRVRALSTSGSPASYYSSAADGNLSGAETTSGTGGTGGTGTSSTTSTSLRVASYNIKCYGCEEDSTELTWEQRRDAVVSAIQAQAPDVIGLQEASQRAMTNSTLSQFDDVAVRLGGSYRLTNAYRYNCVRSTTQGDCVYQDRGASQADRIIYNSSTVTMLRAGSLLLDSVNTTDNVRYFAWAEFKQLSTGKRFLFGTTHLSPTTGGMTAVYNKTYNDLRERQAKQIVAELARINTDALPVVVVGDMNSRWNAPGADGKPSDPQYDVFTGSGLYDPLNGGSVADRAKGPVASLTSIIHANYSSGNDYLRTAPKAIQTLGNNIDFIYLSTAIRATAWETVVKLDASGQLAGIIPSDHNMLRTDVVLP